MSWQEYVDQSLLGTGSIDRAAIYSAAGDSCWASSSGFQPTAAELKEITGAYADTAEVKQVQSSGLHVAGHRYIVLKADARSLYGKNGKEGIIIVKTTQAILIAHYPETVQPGQATIVVEQLGDYLISVGY